jgi:hypothetical protein
MTTKTDCTASIHTWELVREYTGRETFPIEQAYENTDGGQNRVAARRISGGYEFRPTPDMSIEVSTERGIDEYVAVQEEYLACSSCGATNKNVTLNSVEYQ